MERLAVCQEQSNLSGLEDRTPNQSPSGVPANDLQALLKSLVKRYGTQTALAKAIGITDSRLAKVLKGDSGALSVLNCLRLAKVAGMSPSQILRAAGKTEIAVLIENMYGESAQPVLSADEAVKEWWPDISEKAKGLLHGFLEEVATAKKKPPRKPRRKKP